MTQFNRIRSISPYSIREKIKMQLWWIVQATIFRWSLHKMNAWRCMLLRIFGAQVGCGTFIHPTAKIWFPWNLSIGSNAGIGFDALIYSLDKVTIGDFATVSQRCHLNTGSHEYRDESFPLITKPISIEYAVFVGADSYLGMGVRIGSCAVIGARSVVVKDMPNGYLCVGHPCKPIKKIDFWSK